MNIIKIILPILFVGISIFGGIFFVFPKYQVFIDVQTAIDEREERVKRGEEALVKLRELKKQVELRREDFAKLDSAIPAEAALPRTYYELQRIGAESGLVLSNVSSGREQIEQGGILFAKTTVHLEFQGSYQGIKSFLSQVKSSGRMLNTNSILIETQSGEEGVLLLNIDINTYAS